MRKESVFNKKGIEFSFNWIFSVIVGAAILFLAIYGVSRYVGGERTIQDTETAQRLGIVLTQAESALESSARPGNISFSTLTRIMNLCESSGVYGTQGVSVATQSGIGAPWQDAGLPSLSQSRYVFSAATLEGKTFTLYAAPVHFPFRIGNVLVLWSGAYCFVAPPTEVEDELSDLQFDNGSIARVERMSACPQKSTSVCFASNGISSEKCDVSVDLTSRRVLRNGVTTYYEKPLLFAALFSDPGVYECQVRRLFKRGAELAALYRSKSEFVAAHSKQGCSAGLQAELTSYAALAGNMSSRKLSELAAVSDALAKDNERLSCQLWKERAS